MPSRKFGHLSMQDLMLLKSGGLSNLGLQHPNDVKARDALSADIDNEVNFRTWAAQMKREAEHHAAALGITVSDLIAAVEKI